MKHLLRIAIWGLCAAALAACSDDEGPKTPPVEYDVISFETSEGMLDAAGKPVALGDVTIVGEWAGGDFTNVLCGKEYMAEEDSNGSFFDGVLFSTGDRKIGFGSYFTDNLHSGVYDTWGGFALSRNFSRENSGAPNYKEESFSAWATTAAGKSATFAIAYDNGYGEYDYHTPKIRFAEPRQVGYLYMANATVTAQYPSPLENYWFKVVATGYRNGTAGKSVEQVLISGKTIVGDWVKVDCSSLGEIDELRFKVESNDMSGIYLNCPSYFCIDEIALVKK